MSHKQAKKERKKKKGLGPKRPRGVPLFIDTSPPLVFGTAARLLPFLLEKEGYGL